MVTCTICHADRPAYEIHTVRLGGKLIEDVCTECLGKCNPVHLRAA